MARSNFHYLFLFLFVQNSIYILAWCRSVAWARPGHGDRPPGSPHTHSLSHSCFVHIHTCWRQHECSPTPSRMCLLEGVGRHTQGHAGTPAHVQRVGGMLTLALAHACMLPHHFAHTPKSAHACAQEAMHECEGCLTFLRGSPVSGPAILEDSKV